MKGNIFINYRKEDTGSISAVIYNELCKVFGHNNVFKDFNATEPDGDLSKPVHGERHLLLVLIGDNWLSAKDSNGRFYIDNNADAVRLEIASALKNKIAVLPVLIDFAKMPGETELPFELRALAGRQCVSMYNESFERDIFHLVHVIKNTMGLKKDKANMESASKKKAANSWQALKPGTKRSWSVACIVIGLLMVLADQENRNFPMVMLGFTIIGAGAYAYFSGTQVQKQWANGNFEAARNFSRNAGIIAIASLVAGILLAILLKILTGTNNF